MTLGRVNCVVWVTKQRALDERVEDDTVKPWRVAVLFLVGGATDRKPQLCLLT